MKKATATGDATTEEEASTGEAAKNLIGISNDQETEKGEELDSGSSTPLGPETQDLVTVSPSTQIVSSTAEENWYMAPEHPDLGQVLSPSTGIGPLRSRSTVEPYYL